METPKVAEIMTRGAIACNPGTPLDEVARILSDAEVSAIVIVEPDGRLQGVISEFDLLQHFGMNLQGITAHEVMITPVISILLHETVGRAAEIMREKRIHRLVVTDEDRTRVVGVISVSDVIREMRKLGA
jgi:CBS domain-containing protein